MKTKHLYLLVVTILAITLVVPVAFGAESDTEDGYLSSQMAQQRATQIPWWLGIGIRGGGGFNIMFSPGDASALSFDGSAVTPFENGGGGINLIAGAFIENRFLNGQLGLDISIQADYNRTRSNDTYRGADENRFILEYKYARIPVIVEYNIIRDAHRIGLGLGPDFMIALRGDKLDIESDLIVEDNTEARPRHIIGLTAAVSYAYKFGDWFAEFGFRPTFSMNEQRDYSSKVKYKTGDTGFSIVAGHSLDIKLLFSLGYEIGLGAN